MLSAEHAEEFAPLVVTLGDFGLLLQAMKSQGWTKCSVNYVTDRIFYEE